MHYGRYSKRYYNEPPISIALVDTYNSNRSYIDEYMKTHLLRDVGWFYPAVWTSLIYEQLYHVYSPDETMPCIYRMLLTNLKQSRSEFRCNLVVGYRNDVCPSFVYPYLRDREVGHTR